MIRCRPLHNKADETIAIAIVDAKIYIDIVDVLVMSLLKIVHNELSLRGYSNLMEVRRLKISISIRRTALAEERFSQTARQRPACGSPYGRKVLRLDMVFGKASYGYIADDGDGIDSTQPVIKLQPRAQRYMQSDVLPNFSTFEGAPYMYRVTNAQGLTEFRTDIFSRKQIARGGTDPQGAHFSGGPSTLDGTKSCSLVSNIDTVSEDFEGTSGKRIPEAEFWHSEFVPGLTVPTHMEDLIIYELHVNALGSMTPTLPDGFALFRRQALLKTPESGTLCLCVQSRPL